MSFRDVLYGIAIGDAIGNSLEFISPVSDSDFNAAAAEPVLVVSDDTQMTLFLAEALFSFRGSPIMAIPKIKAGYLNWLVTQNHSFSPGGNGLLQFPSMFSVEAPGTTCISALSALAVGRTVNNNSKGNGTVMRCAPIAFWRPGYYLPVESCYHIARMDAELTHKHPYAAAMSMFLTGLYFYLNESVDFVGSVLKVMDDLSRSLDAHCLRLIHSVLSPAGFQRAKCLGGWVAEEALALAIGAVACTTTYEDAIREAVTIDGDSDTVGGIAGGLAAAAGRVVPSSWSARINVGDAIEYVLANT